MASMLTFSWRKAQESNHRPQRHLNQARQHTDPWALGISTSTSSADSLPTERGNGAVGSTSSVQLTPPTPEGLRPRKPVHKIRSQLHATGIIGRLPLTEVAASTTLREHHNVRHQSPGPISCFPLSFSCGSTEIPSILQRTGKHPQIPTGSLYSKPSGRNADGGELEDEDIDDNCSNYNFDNDVSSLHGSPSRNRHRSRLVAVSPDLQRGKAKTAVGALIVAMSEQQLQFSEPGNKKDICGHHSATIHPSHEQSQHSILPPRAWMDDDEDDTIRDDTIENGNETSLHMSPSSNPWRRSTMASWKERQAQFQQDTSFTRGFLSQDPNCSWMHDQETGHPPYNFESIVPDRTFSGHAEGNLKHGPPILAVTQAEENELNVSAISHSYHVRDLEGLNSLADTMDDEEEDFIEDSIEIPKYYHALTDEDLVGGDTKDKALLLVKAQNQRRIKEELILSTCERLHDELELMMDLMSEINLGNDLSNHNYLFLGLDKEKRFALCNNLEKLQMQQNESVKKTSDFDLKGEDSNEARSQSLLFCLSLLQLAPSSVVISSQRPTPTRHSYSSIVVNHRWKCIAGFRESLGLEEDPRSPPTIRGGDTSLFSLPSDSFNDSTPHTSNVSMTTTITTVISPTRNARQQQRQHPPWTTFDSSDQTQDDLGQRKTLETLVLLLSQLESAGMRLLHETKSIESTGNNVEVVDEIKRIYLEMLNLSMADLKRIVDSFELILEEPPNSHLTRMVSEDVESDMAPQNDVEVSESIASIDSKLPCDMVPGFSNIGESRLSQTKNLSSEFARIDVLEQEDESQDMKGWFPINDDMNSIPVAPGWTSERSEENEEDEPDQTTDDLRRVVGSFELESVQEERDAAPSWDSDERDEGEEPINGTIRTGLGGGTSRNRMGRFWKRRFLAPKLGRHVSAE